MNFIEGSPRDAHSSSGSMTDGFKDVTNSRNTPVRLCIRSGRSCD